MKSILYVSLVVCFTYGFFWRELPKGSFYILNALFIVYICLYMFLTDRKSFIKYYLLSLSTNNLLDEWLFDNTKIGYNEYIFVLILPLIWFIIHKSNARKSNQQ